MNDTERLILIRALATNCRENVKNGDNDSNDDLIFLLHEYAFGIGLDPLKGDEIDLSLGTDQNYSAPNWDNPVNLAQCLRGLADNVQHYCERDRLLILRAATELEKRTID